MTIVTCCWQWQKQKNSSLLSSSTSIVIQLTVLSVTKSNVHANSASIILLKFSSTNKKQKKCGKIFLPSWSMLNISLHLVRGLCLSSIALEWTKEKRYLNVHTTKDHQWLMNFAFDDFRHLNPTTCAHCLEHA